MTEEPVPQAESEANGRAGPQSWPPFVDQWVLPFLRESGLWPVLVALLGHVVVIIAPLLLALFRGNPGASLPLTILVMGSFWLCHTEFEVNGRRPGPVAGVVFATWAVSAVTAWYAGTSGYI